MISEEFLTARNDGQPEKRMIFTLPTAKFMQHSVHACPEVVLLLFLTSRKQRGEKLDINYQLSTHTGTGTREGKNNKDDEVNADLSSFEVKLGGAGQGDMS